MRRRWPTRACTRSRTGWSFAPSTGWARKCQAAGALDIHLADGRVLSGQVDQRCGHPDRLMAVADAQQVLRLVRRNADRWRIDPAKVWMHGYLAGGGVSIGAAMTPVPGAQPDFIISAYGPSLVDVTPAANHPPLFIAVRQFHTDVALALIALYRKWTKAKAPAELHVFDQLGDRPFLPPTAEWLDLAYEWMGKRGFAPAAPVAAAQGLVRPAGH